MKHARHLSMLAQEPSDSGQVGGPDAAQPIDVRPKPVADDGGTVANASGESAACSAERSRAADVGLTGASKPVVLEVCCGSAGLTLELCVLEFEAIGIDHSKNRHTPKAKILVINLATQHGRTTLCELCRDERVVAVWFGVPCGTASRAREIPHKKGPSIEVCAGTLGEDRRPIRRIAGRWRGKGAAVERGLHHYAARHRRPQSQARPLDD